MHPIRKPRVFLSHAKRDIEFIRRLETDLRHAQCEPWIDELEIRPGQPWLDQIFSTGIPSCEVVFCYITENSLESAVFKQEMDARIIERLQNSRVALLLYVENVSLRSRLRLDLQRLQIPELNDANYASMFPRAVAEIWRCYSEINVATAVEAEKVRRLEAELRVKELESNATATVFSASEHSEFKIIWSRLDRDLDIVANISPQKSLQTTRADGDPAVVGDGAPEAITRKFAIKQGNLFRASIAPQKFQPDKYLIHNHISNDILLQSNLPKADYTVSIEPRVDMDGELLKFGLVERQTVPPQSGDNRIVRMMSSQFRLVFTSKFDRFGFWLENHFGPYDQLNTVVRPRQ